MFPLFLFAGLLMLMPLTILIQERQVQAVLETVTEQICQMPKAEELGESVWYGIVMAELTGKLDNERIRNLSLKKSTFFTPEDEIDLIAEYEIGSAISCFADRDRKAAKSQFSQDMDRKNGNPVRKWTGGRTG